MTYIPANMVVPFFLLVDNFPRNIFIINDLGVDYIVDFGLTHFLKLLMFNIHQLKLTLATS